MCSADICFPGGAWLTFLLLQEEDAQGGQDRQEDQEGDELGRQFAESETFGEGADTDIHEIRCRYDLAEHRGAAFE